jgi:hypothetical protein
MLSATKVAIQLIQCLKNVLFKTRFALIGEVCLKFTNNHLVKQEIKKSVVRVRTRSVEH